MERMTAEERYAYVVECGVDPNEASFAGLDTLPVEPPQPLMRETVAAAAFPVDALGNDLAAAARAIEQKTQAAEATAAQAALAAASLTVQAQADVELPTGQVKPISNYLVSVAESGDRKSSADDIAVAPIREHERALHDQWQTASTEYRNQMEAYEAERRRITGDRKRYATCQERAAALTALGDEPERPPLPLLLCDEPTSEGLFRLLRDGQHSVGVFSTEGGQFLSGHAMRDENRIRTAGALSQMWDGTPLRRVRASDDASVLHDRRVSAHLMVQPLVARQLLMRADLQDQGFLSRLLIVAPESRVGRRLWRDPDPASELALHAYYRRVAEQLAKSAAAAVDLSRAGRATIRLSSEARELWIAFADEVERKCAPDQELHEVRSYANKLPEHAIRLACTRLVYETQEVDKLDADRLAGGIVLAQYYLGEVVRLHEAAEADDQLVRAKRALDWILGPWAERYPDAIRQAVRNGAGNEPCPPFVLISLPDLYTSGPREIRDSERALPIVDILEDHGWLVRLDGTATVAGVRRRTAWVVIGPDGQPREIGHP